MDSESDNQFDVRVNFGRPMPVFAIDGLVVLPQQIVPLHIFEARYRQMIGRALDGSGQIAMALFEPVDQAAATPALRRSVCVCQIVQHEKLDDGRYNILVQGVCRATIDKEHPPTGERLYPEATLRPADRGVGDVEALSALREWIVDELEAGPLSRLTSAEDLLNFMRNDDIPSSTVLEVIAFTLVHSTESRYRLLSEANEARRASKLKSELESTRRMIRLADRQRPEDWPKGVSWN